MDILLFTTTLVIQSMKKVAAIYFSILEQQGLNKKVMIEDVLLLLLAKAKGKLKISSNKFVVEKLVGIFLVKS